MSRIDVYASTTGSHTCHSPWNMGDDRYGNPCMAAVHAQGHNHKDAKCNPCVKIGKNLKSIIPANIWHH